MSFELFQDTRARTTEYISVTENYTFGLPRIFLDKQHITVKHKAVILFDAKELKVALHFSLADPKFGLTVRIPNSSQGGSVVAKSFFELKGIDPKKYSGRYYDFDIKPLKDIGFDKSGSAYIIQLKEKEPESVSNQFGNSSSNPFIIEDIDDVPINLDDIPF